MSKVSVIIPAYNESEVIDDCLQSLVEQEFFDFTAYIIDDASTDDTRERIEKYCKMFPHRIQLLEFGKVGPGKARNLAARQSPSEIIAFMDADCIASPSWLKELVRVFEDHPDAVSVGGPHRAPSSSSPFQIAVEKFFHIAAGSVDFFQSHENEVKECKHNPLCNTSYRRKDFLELNGFREDLFPGEDIELDLRMKSQGKKIFYNPAALVYHHRPENIERFRKVMFAYGRAQGKLVRERGIERKIQWIGILMIIPAFILFPRPRWNNLLGVVWNSLDWANGFIQGFWTNRSDPPGMLSPPK